MDFRNSPVLPPVTCLIRAELPLASFRKQFVRVRMVRTLFVGGLGPQTRAEDVRAEFERFGRLTRCDLPTPKGRPGGFAFIEYEDDRHAEEAFERMQGSRVFGGRDLGIQWARHGPSRGWRYSSRSPSPSRRPRSPPRFDRGGYDRSYDRGYDRPYERGYERGGYDRSYDRGYDRGGYDRGGYRDDRDRYERRDAYRGGYDRERDYDRGRQDYRRDDRYGPPPGIDQQRPRTPSPNPGVVEPYIPPPPMDVGQQQLPQ